MEDLSAKRIRAWLDTLPRETRERLFLLLDELCAGLDVSRHNQFGFLRLRAEFETSGELFGCTISELRDAIARTLGDVSALRPARPQSPLEELRADVGSHGHPDFR
ncbi:MAG TPA: hypothetical protein VGT60_12975 [Candidatus Limnocylindria bacterium]|nr:hypothetical protein [Candidatus Limnocylindria bacterium]